MNPVDTLSEIAADLVEFEEHEPFLDRLFQLEPGVWVSSRYNKTPQSCIPLLRLTTCGFTIPCT